MLELKTIGIKELSVLLRRAPGTIRVDVSRRPHTLPPTLRLGGSKKVMWLLSDVEEWIQAQSRIAKEKHKAICDAARAVSSPPKKKNNKWTPDLKMRITKKPPPQSYESWFKNWASDK